jgi:hypothetical protein
VGPVIGEKGGRSDDEQAQRHLLIMVQTSSGCVSPHRARPPLA